MKPSKYLWIVPLALLGAWLFWHFVVNSEARKDAIMEKNIGPLPEK